MKRVLSWLVGVSAGFVFFTIAIQMVIGMSTGQNFTEIPWTSSMALGGILALIAGAYESLEA